MNTISPKLATTQGKMIKRSNKNLTIGQSSLHNISFKGVPPSLITDADRQILNVFSQHYGNVGERLGKKVGKLVTSSDKLNKMARFSLDKGITSIREKSVGRALAENIIFPFVNLPLYAVSWVLKKAQTVPALKEGARSIYNKGILRIPRKLNELDQKTDMLKGMFDKTQDTIAKFAKEKGLSTEYLIQQLNQVDDTPEARRLVQEANEFIKENLYKVSNKFFDKHTGNFNTAFERPLNRIVTGLIPVAFLANDAYNLSVLCGDSKDVSKKEAYERKKQEISRVFTTAYIQLLTFGAFTKQVNTIPWFTPLTSAATVLFSETTSRKRLGKPVFFLSKEKAKEYNKRNEENKQTKTESKKLFSFKKGKEKLEDKTPVETKPVQKEEKVLSDAVKTTAVSAQSPFVATGSEPQIFTSFKSNVNNTPQTTQTDKTENQNKETKETKERKALINFNTFKKGVLILITGGFILSFLKNSSYTKDTKIIKAIKDFGNLCKKKIYEPLAFKDFEITQSEFEKVAKSLKDSGCKEIAEGHEFIKNKYGRQLADGTIKMYQGSFASSKASDVATNVVKSLNMEDSHLADYYLTQVTEAVKTALRLEKTSVLEMKYSEVSKKAAEILKNKKLNITAEEMEILKDTITESIRKGAVETPITIETKAKPFVDMVTQPFKFIMSAMKLPFKITSTMVKMAVSPIEKKAEQAAIGKAELNNIEKTIHKVVKNIFGEATAKDGKTSQKIFANAMEQLQKRTMPYRKAQEALDAAMKNGVESEITKAKSALDKAKNDLLVYVNTAVEKSFNGVTQSSNKNTDLAMMSKLASSAVTSAFLVADNYNMVMLKSNGEDTEGAKEKANERIIQRLSALFYQTMFINWFNSTFRATYNSSLKGMAAVAIPNTITTEVITRKSIGMPVGRKSLEELNEIDEKNENRTGFIGKYFKFMRLLTGKKPLKDRMPKDNKTKPAENTQIKPAIQENPTTNLLEMFSK